MAQSSWPFENVDTSETQFSLWARNIGEGVKTGALNELEIFADSTGMQVKARSGQALVRGHYYQNTAEVALTLQAADPSQPRVDTVLLELDPSANSIELKVITGVAESSPSPEPLVQTDAGVYQIKLANVAVGAGVFNITAGNVTDTREFIEDFKGTVPGSAITGEITTATIDGDRLFNQIDSATIPADNVTGLTLDKISDVTASATEVNKLDGLTASTTELNKLDGLTPTTTELNFVDGVTSGIQSQLNNKQNDVITTQGDLIIGDASGDPVRLPVGSADQVLTSDGTTLSFQDAGGGGAGGLTLLTSVTPTATATFIISGLAGYSTYYIELEGIRHNTGSQREIFIAQINGDSTGKSIGMSFEQSTQFRFKENFPGLSAKVVDNTKELWAQQIIQNAGDNGSAISTFTAAINNNDSGNTHRIGAARAAKNGQPLDSITFIALSSVFNNGGTVRVYGG